MEKYDNLIVLIGMILLANWAICAFYTKEYYDLVPRITTEYVFTIIFMWVIPILGLVYVRQKIKELSSASCGRDTSDHLSSESRYDDWDDD